MWHTNKQSWYYSPIISLHSFKLKITIVQPNKSASDCTNVFCIYCRKLKHKVRNHREKKETVSRCNPSSVNTGWKHLARLIPSPVCLLWLQQTSWAPQDWGWRRSPHWCCSSSRHQRSCQRLPSVSVCGRSGPSVGLLTASLMCSHFQT